MTDYAEMLDRFDAANAALLQSQAREVGADARIEALEQKLIDMNEAWIDDMDRASQFLRERDESREAVRRLAGALDGMLAGHRECDVIAVGILNDDVVKRIVEGS